MSKIKSKKSSGNNSANQNMQQQDSGGTKTNNNSRSTLSSQKSATNSALNPANNAIDPSQLLALCYRINENMTKLDKSIRLIQLRFTTLNYVCNDNAHDPWPTNCLGELVELCKLSELLVTQLDELHAKLDDNPLNSISFHIASQQLAYFTCEWYDNLTPKFEQTLSMADRYIDLATGAKRANVPKQKKGQASPAAASGSNATGLQASSTTSVEMRVQEALMRLKQSMGENEQLIASISNNLEYTKTTVETIYNSLQTTKGQLEQGERNTIESIGIVRQSAKTKLIVTLICTIIVVVMILIVFRIVGII